MKLKKTQLRASGLNMSHEPEVDNISDAYVVNQGDKTANTPAYQGYKAGKKNQITGEPLYKKGNMKENLVTIEKFNNVANINVKPSNYTSEKDVIKEILEKGTKGKVEFHSGRSDKENRQVMKTKRKTVNNPKGRKIHQSPMGKTIGKLNQVKSKQYDAEKKSDMKTASKMMDRRSKLSGTLYDKTGKFYDRADND